MESNNIKLATYNLHGMNQGLPLLESLCQDCDIVCIQEHWLAPFDLCRLDNVCSSMICYASSAMESAVAKGCLRGRPYGGVACLVRDSLATRTKLVKTASRFIILQIDDIVLINVYLPCVSSDNWDVEYLDCLASIINVMSELQYMYIILAGDMNIDFLNCHKGSMYTTVANSLMTFAQQLRLKFTDDKCIDKATYTFRAEFSGAASFIDHIAVSEDLYDDVSKVEVIDSGINLSDHCPVVMDLSIVAPKSRIAYESHTGTTRKHQLAFRWDIGDVVHYYNLTGDLLSAIQVPSFLLCGAPSNRETALDCINSFYSSIVHALYDASITCIPRKKHGFFKYWWDEELTLLKESAIKSFKLWAALGKPRNGNVFDEMRRDKARYKLAIKTKSDAGATEFSDSLNDALMCKDMNEFWNTWRSKFTKSHPARVIDGHCGDDSIANRFAEVFSSVCVPNSNVRHAQLRDEFFELYTGLNNHMDSDHSISVELIQKCVAGLKRGKAAGIDELTCEHVLHSHPILIVLLANLFKIMLAYGMVPDAFGQGIIIPLVKNVDGDKTVSENYRSITLSPVISKLFESVLLDLFSDQLCSDNLQFGFKSRSSCSHAIFTLRTIVDHYVKDASTVTISALDISKAFDRVDHFALLRLLIKRQLPNNFISILLDWFSKCYACVRWGGVYSHFFQLQAGVRQGGLMSPILFAIYMDVLIVRLRSCGYGCRLLDEFHGCLLYADDIILLTHSVNAMRVMLDICDQFAIDFDIKFNSKKSVAMRVGTRFNVKCAPLILSGCELQFAQSIKYLGICVTAAKYFKCTFEHAKLKFFRTFNAIYSKAKGAQSELVSVELLKSYCMPLILYACEAVPISKSAVNMLENCINVALYRIFGITSKNAVEMRQYIGLPPLHIAIEQRRAKFMDKLYLLPNFRTVLTVCTLD